MKSSSSPNSVNKTFKENKRVGAIKAVIKPLPEVKGRVLTLYDGSFIVKSAKLRNTLTGKLAD